MLLDLRQHVCVSAPNMYKVHEQVLKLSQDSAMVYAHTVVGLTVVRSVICVVETFVAMTVVTPVVIVVEMVKSEELTALSRHQTPIAHELPLHLTHLGLLAVAGEDADIALTELAK